MFFESMRKGVFGPPKTIKFWVRKQQSLNLRTKNVYDTGRNESDWNLSLLPGGEKLVWDDLMKFWRASTPFESEGWNFQGLLVGRCPKYPPWKKKFPWKKIEKNFFGQKPKGGPFSFEKGPPFGFVDFSKFFFLHIRTPHGPKRREKWFLSKKSSFLVPDPWYPPGAQKKFSPKKSKMISE